MLIVGRTCPVDGADSEAEAVGAVGVTGVAGAGGDPATAVPD